MKPVLFLIALKGAVWTAKHLMKTRNLTKRQASREVLKLASKHDKTIAKIKEKHKSNFNVPESVKESLKNPKKRSDGSAHIGKMDKVTKKGELLNFKNDSSKRSFNYIEQSERLKTNKKVAEKRDKLSKARLLEEKKMQTKLDDPTALTPEEIEFRVKARKLAAQRKLLRHKQAVEAAKKAGKQPENSLLKSKRIKEDY